jgi:hypothetical protein
MNEARHPVAAANTQARLREVLEQVERPDFVQDFDVQLDQFDDEPAAWVTLKLSGSDEIGIAELRRRAKVLFDFQEILKERFSSANIALWTFFPITYLSEIQVD